MMSLLFVDKTSGQVNWGVSPIATVVDRTPHRIWYTLVNAREGRIDSAFIEDTERVEIETSD